MSKILGLGNDIICVARIKESIDKFGSNFLDKLFTEKEQQYCSLHRNSATRFAGRFAVKEAIAKAFGTGFGKEFGWHDVEVLNDPETGKPYPLFSEKAKKLMGNASIHITISHCEEYASAVAIWQSH